MGACRRTARTSAARTRCPLAREGPGERCSRRTACARTNSAYRTSFYLRRRHPARVQAGHDAADAAPGDPVDGDVGLLQRGQQAAGGPGAGAAPGEREAQGVAAGRAASARSDVGETSATTVTCQASRAATQAARRSSGTAVPTRTRSHPTGRAGRASAGCERGVATATTRSAWRTARPTTPGRRRDARGGRGAPRRGPLGAGRARCRPPARGCHEPCLARARRQGVGDSAAGAPAVQSRPPRRPRALPLPGRGRGMAPAGPRAPGPRHRRPPGAVHDREEGLRLRAGAAGVAACPHGGAAGAQVSRASSPITAPGPSSRTAEPSTSTSSRPLTSEYAAPARSPATNRVSPAESSTSSADPSSFLAGLRGQLGHQDGAPAQREVAVG